MATHKSFALHLQGASFLRPRHPKSSSISTSSSSSLLHIIPLVEKVAPPPSPACLLVDVCGGGLGLLLGWAGVSEATELVLVDGVYDLGGDGRQLGFLPGEVCVKVVPVFLCFLKGYTNLEKCQLRSVLPIKTMTHYIYLDKPISVSSIHVTVSTCFVTSHLDSCNSSLFRSSNSQINRLQKVKNAASYFVTNSRSSCNTHILKSLHRLPFNCV